MPRGNHKTSKLAKDHPRVDPLIEGLCVILNNIKEQELKGREITELERLRAILQKLLVYVNDKRVLALVGQVMKRGVNEQK